MRKFFAMLILLGFLSGIGIKLYSVTVLDGDDYVQGYGDDEPESWDDDNNDGNDVNEE
ncbi:MAG: hypothetical protein WCW33_02145 [Candidatus Babeliales bacterium]|jgi:hypothetical protein